MNLVDSSGWLEYLADGKQAKHFAKPLESTAHLIVPTICIYEVFKSILRQRGEEDALQAVMLMQQPKVVDLDVPLSLNAAKISHETKLPMADSIILVTAHAHKATIWTRDSDFKPFENVKYFT